MKKLTAILFTFLATMQLCAQQVPDNDEIIARTIDSNSPFYYPALMLRYTSGDEALTDQDYFYLYYGYPFSGNYKPLDAISAADAILEIFAENGEPNGEQLTKIVELGKLVMERDPFSPKNLNFLTYAYGALGDTINEQRYHRMMTNILKTIGNSGTGRTEGSPMHVLWFSHAADWIADKNLTIKNRQVVGIGKEFIYLTKKYEGRQGFYFDFSRVYLERPEQTPKKERTWQFNNLPVKKR